MTPQQKKDQTAEGMRTAPEERLNRLLKEKGVDLMRLRRYVAFDRILARFFQNKPGWNFVGTRECKGCGTLKKWWRICAAFGKQTHCRTGT